MPRGTSKYNLQITHPNIAKEWHPFKNETLRPNDVTRGSIKNIWWICEKGHEWEDTANHRTGGRGCPYCSGRRVCEDNCLENLNPRLASEWHPTKNGVLTARDVTKGSRKRIWWICKRGHEWEVSISNRSRGQGCPICHSQTSKLELRVYTEFKYLFTEIGHRKRFNGRECDIYIPSLKVGIEIDGFYWHKDKQNADKEKADFLLDKGICLLRIREKGLKKLSSNDIIFNYNENHLRTVTRILKKLLLIKPIPQNLKGKIYDYFSTNQLRNNDEYLQLIETLPSPLPGDSLEECNKSLSLQWHYARNGSLTPRDVTPNSNWKIWWICDKGHEWEAFIYQRNKGSGCPYCAGQRALDENCLHFINPDLARDWHTTKNESLTPMDVMPNSHKSVWWVCHKGHEYISTVKDRTRGNGCPYCSGKAICDDNCLHTLNPKLASEWHSTKNGDLTPRDVTANSGKKVWWVCEKHHEWRTSVDNRNRRKGTGCPYCAGRKKIVAI